MAVYTQLTPDEIQAQLSAYNLPPLHKAEGIRAGVENTNYLLVLQDESKFILTLFERRVTDADIPFFCGLMERLAKRNVPCPMPIAAKDGIAIRHIKGKPALITSFLYGQESAVIENTHIQELGSYIARLHIAGENYERNRPNALSLAGWQELYAKIIHRADEIMPNLTQLLTEEIAFTKQFWPRDLPEGVIHADLFPDNVFYDQENKLSGIIDFYFACNDFWMYDLAICLNAWCFKKNGEYDFTKAQLLFSAYSAIRPFSKAEKAALPILARGAALRFLLTRAHDWLFPVTDAFVTPKDPMEYVRKLQFHRTNTASNAYGL